MIRTVTEADREYFLLTADAFYRTDAVEKPLSMKKLTAIFDELMRSHELIQGYIFECDGKRAGYAITAHAFQTESAGLTVWIEDLFISAEFRRKGLGSEFFDMLHKLYEGRVCRFRLEVEPENTAAFELYKKSGFRVLPYTEMVEEFDYDN